MTGWILGEKQKRSADSFSVLDSFVFHFGGEKCLTDFCSTTGLCGQIVQHFLTVQRFISTENLKKRSTDGPAALDSVVFHLDIEILR